MSGDKLPIDDWGLCCVLYCTCAIGALRAPFVDLSRTVSSALPLGNWQYLDKQEQLRLRTLGLF